MEIILDGEKLDVEFENEKYLDEVLSGVANWLESDGYYLKEFCVDGKLYSSKGNSKIDFTAFQQDFSTVERLELSSAVALDSEKNSCNTLQESLQTLHDYFQLASSAFADGRFVFLQDLFCAPEALFELLERSIATCSESEMASYELRQALSEWDYFQEPEQQALKLGQGASKRMQDTLYNIQQLLAAQLTPKSDIVALKRSLGDKQLELENAVVQLQNGQIEQCMHLVSDLSLLLEQLLKDTREDSKLGALFLRLKPFLQELTTAIEETDTVAIGDLVEYEIIPLIQQIVDELD